MMITGMLWYDDSGMPLDVKILGALKAHKEKHHRTATVCVINPLMRPPRGVPNIEGVDIRFQRNVLLDHFWVGDDRTL